MKPTEILVKEHDSILAMIEVMNAVCRKISAGEKVDPGHLKQIVDFIRSYADRFHHAKEEDLLFKSLEKTGIPAEGGPIGVMLQEHETGRAFVGNMADAIDACQQRDSGSAERFAENARGYGELLTQHIEKENTVLYPMADMHLSPEEQDRLLREFARVEEEHAGAPGQKDFHAVLEKLRKEYL